MKLRNLVLFLLLANALFFAWAQGWFGVWGFAPSNESEPQHMQEQLNAEALKLQTDARARKIAKLNNPAQCLTTGMLNPATAQSLSALAEQLLPKNSWTMQSFDQPGRWMIYMGRYASEAAVERKKEELQRLRITDIQSPPDAYRPGIALGYFTSYAQAQEGHKQIINKGVRSSRIITEVEPVTGQQMRVERADETMRDALAKMRPVLNGQDFVPCK